MGRYLFALPWLLIFVCPFHRVDATYNYLNTSCVVKNGNYMEGSVYQQNLDILLSSLSSEASSLPFYNSTAGDGPTKTYGLYQCRGDVSQEVCAECIQDATQKIVQECPLVVEAAVWYDECFLWYGNRSIFSMGGIYPRIITWSLNNVSDYDILAPVLAKSLRSVINEAAQNSSRGYFATKAANWTNFYSVYCLAQCTPDLTKFQCRNCLTRVRSIMVNSYSTSTLVGIISVSCQLRYDTTQQFYRDISSEPPAPSPSNTSVPDEVPKKPGLKPPIIVGIAVGASVGVILVVGGLCFWLRQNKSKAPSTSTSTAIAAQPPPPTELDNAPSDTNYGGHRNNVGEVEFVQYDFATLRAATRNFSAIDKLGEGGFGVVYLGTLNNAQVAIKRLSGNSGQGAKEFMTEAQIVAKLQHKNLVRLLGFCSEGEEKLLVYEFLPNTSLDRFLFDPMERAILDWELRFKIIMGIARGLQYLHEDSRLTIIHRDLKPSNILLDKDMNPKIADFGLARLFEKEQALANTTRIIGKHGYMAPEYMLTGDYSDKTDVYSFGIILLELVSGKRNRVLYQSSPREDLSIQAWRLWNVGRSSEIIDPTLNKRSMTEVTRCIQIGLLCVQQISMRRPTMEEVMLMLTGTIALQSPTAPAMPPKNFNVATSSNDSGRESEQYRKSSAWYADKEQDLYPR